MRACRRCGGPNSTMSGLCVGCQVWWATEKALRSHECAEKLRKRDATAIRADVFRDPVTIP